MLRFTCCLLLGLWTAGHVAAKEPTSVLIVVGPSTHPPGSHEVAAGGRLMAYCLNQQQALSKLRAEVVYEWPNAKEREAADTVVFIGDTFPAHRFPNAAQNLRELGAMMDRGCGIVCVHYATGLLGKDVGPAGEHPLLEWMGGYFANRSCPHHQSIARIYPSAKIERAAESHPISRGWKTFTVHDEPYINNYFGTRDNTLKPNVTALAVANLPPERPSPETVAWCTQRDDGGRGFGIVMPHFYKNWQNDDLRTFILNGIVWSAHREVPSDGVRVPLPELTTFEPAAVEFSRKN